MVAKITLTLFLLTIGAFAINAQSIHTPEKGSSERKEILDALRVSVERDLKQSIVFVPDHFNVQGNWAFIEGRPQTPDGKDPNYSITKYREAVDSGAFDNNFFALLKRTGQIWKVATYAIGCTDVCYVDWWRRYRAPKAIFPYTE
jgi:hypothetical protein